MPRTVVQREAGLGGEGQGASLGNGEREKTDSAEGCFCNRETVTCQPHGAFSRPSAKTASNTSQGQKRMQECGGSSQGVEWGLLTL